MDPAEPNLFETLRLPNVAAMCFVVRCKNSKVNPNNIPAAGVAYGGNDYKLPTRLHVESWASYVCGWPTEAPAGYTAFIFVPALPTVPTVKPRLDPIWGAVIDHSYYCLRSSTQLDVADTGATIAILGASYSSHHVIEVRPPREMSGEVIEVTVTTAATNTVTQTDRPVDPRTGLKFNRTRTWTVADTAPAAADLGSGGLQTEVSQVSYKTFLSTIQPVNMRVGIENKQTYTLYQAMVWPAVLTDFDVKNLTEYQSGNGYQRYTVATYGLAPAYAEPVRVVVDEWWQLAAPADGDLTGKSTPFQPTGIHINGLRTPPAISPCLHGEVVFTAQVYDETESAYSVYEVTIDATAGHTTWPETYVEYEVQPDSGGYTVKKLTWHRPFVPSSSVTSTVTPA